jgi:hypothetical protein
LVLMQDRMERLEVDYLRGLAGLLVRRLFPERDWRCNAVRHFVREVLATCILQSVTSLISEPDNLNSWLLSSLRAVTVEPAKGGGGVALSPNPGITAGLAPPGFPPAKGWRHFAGQITRPQAEQLLIARKAAGTFLVRKVLERNEVDLYELDYLEECGDGPPVARAAKLRLTPRRYEYAERDAHFFENVVGLADGFSNLDDLLEAVEAFAKKGIIFDPPPPPQPDAGREALSPDAPVTTAPPTPEPLSPLRPNPNGEGAEAGEELEDEEEDDEELDAILDAPSPRPVVEGVGEGVHSAGGEGGGHSNPEVPPVLEMELLVEEQKNVRGIEVQAAVDHMLDLREGDARLVLTRGAGGYEALKRMVRCLEDVVRYGLKDEASFEAQGWGPFFALDEVPPEEAIPPTGGPEPPQPASRPVGPGEEGAGGKGEVGGGGEEPGSKGRRRSFTTDWQQMAAQRSPLRLAETVVTAIGNTAASVMSPGGPAAEGEATDTPVRPRRRSMVNGPPGATGEDDFFVGGRWFMENLGSVLDSKSAAARRYSHSSTINTYFANRQSQENLLEPAELGEEKEAEGQGQAPTPAEAAQAGAADKLKVGPLSIGSQSAARQSPIDVH